MSINLIKFILLLMILGVINGCTSSNNINRLIDEVDIFAKTTKSNCNTIDCFIDHSNKVTKELFFKKLETSKKFCIVHHFTENKKSNYFDTLYSLKSIIKGKYVTFFAYKNDLVSNNDRKLVQSHLFLLEDMYKKLNSIRRTLAFLLPYTKGEFSMLPQNCREIPVLIVTSDGKLSLLTKQAGFIYAPNYPKTEQSNLIISFIEQN
jgi:hypothetical protein